MNFNLIQMQYRHINQPITPITMTIIKKVITSALMLISLAVMSLINSTTAIAANNEGWFEIEVILLNQLGDKSHLKEVFGDENLKFKDSDKVSSTGIKKSYKKVTKKKAGSSSAYKHRKNRPTLNLLHEFANPDFQSIKQAMPLCDTSQVAFSDNKAQQQESFNLLLNDSFLRAITGQESNGVALHSEVIKSEVESKKVQTEALRNKEALKRRGTFSDDLVYHSANKSTSIANNITDGEALNNIKSFDQLFKDFRISQISWLAQGEQILTTGQSNIINEAQLDLFSNLKALTPKADCVWSKPYFDYTQKNVLHQNSSSNQSAPQKIAGYNDYLPEKMPLIIDAAEDLTSKKPYLLSKESLALSSIVQELKNSRNFKLLMHFGWRQYTVNKRRATPLKVMAGENLATQYTMAERNIFNAENAYKLALASAQKENTYIDNNGQFVSEASLQTEQLEQVKQYVEIEKSRLINKHLSDIYENVNDIEPEKETLIAELNAPIIYDEAKLKKRIEQITIRQNSESQFISPNPPSYTLGEKPFQPWFLEGLLTVHVRHYLHITADFNMMNRSTSVDDFLVEKTEHSALKKDTPLHNIHFEQDRRVISKEIHYFDHPYMGMIVQIRRYTPPEPEKETEVVNEIQEYKWSSN